ncbi:MAG: hypothetical protein HC910_01890 [Spirulinaceae cyanobacterium SM2_1_0]|nr:hypothetical protein [Spirulinaceae cyanobacterium SM2_1_0]
MSNEISPDPENILEQLRQGRILVVGRRRNGLILFKRRHAEFAGPGAIVGGIFDDVEDVLPIGNLMLTVPEDSEQRQHAYKTRRQWILQTRQITSQPDPEERAREIIERFEMWFSAEITERIPDDAFALLIGVLPSTVSQVRQSRHL